MPNSKAFGIFCFLQKRRKNLSLRIKMHDVLFLFLGSDTSKAIHFYQNKSQMKTINKISIITFLALIILSLTACKDSDKDNTIAGTITADTEGTVTFMFSRLNQDLPEFCTFTTNLAAPNDRFVLGSHPTGIKEITDLTPGQAVNWTATTTSGKLYDSGSSIGSSHFVHINYY
jgi:hypothetical protein